MSDTTRNETVATDDPPVGDGEAGTGTDSTTATESATPADSTPDEDADTPAAAVDDDDSGNSDDDLTDEDDDEDDDEPAGRPMGLVIALGAVAALAVVALAVTALLYPGFLVKPGSPDARATEMTTALANKDAAALESLSCHDQQGLSSNPFPPDVMSIVQSATPSGPAELKLDTQARAPVDIVVSAGGQTQTLPADLVLAVTDGNWCMTGVSQRG
ncbi:hypothetical protein [Actinomycetospora chibensis]|uniref:Uncharacterized protein n=1 Tax=Actinomycetospora chibensis TaxID=663606 RepID=A0ABV9RIH3_9PSEU|nr:hypothetical protein [Actinomycetospora chibensis]MDD7926901.1 hypothetical protein [Actinomycetospora chibensis]